MYVGLRDRPMKASDAAGPLLALSLAPAQRRSLNSPPHWSARADSTERQVYCFLVTQRAASAIGALELARTEHLSKLRPVVVSRPLPERGPSVGIRGSFDDVGVEGIVGAGSRPTAVRLLDSRISRRA